MLAELNIPIAAVQARVAEQAARQSMAATRCAREMAMREAERAQREAMRSRAKMARGSSQPISFAPSLPDDFAQRMQFQTAALADRLAARTVSVQLAADKFEEVSQQADAADLADFAVDAEHDAANSGSQLVAAVANRGRSGQSVPCERPAATSFRKLSTSGSRCNRFSETRCFRAVQLR